MCYTIGYMESDIPPQPFTRNETPTHIVWQIPHAQKPFPPDEGETSQFFEENPFVGPYEELRREIQKIIFTSQFGAHIFRQKSLPEELLEQIQEGQGVAFAEVTDIPAWNFDDPEEVARTLARLEGFIQFPHAELEESTSVWLEIDNRREEPQMNVSMCGFPLSMLVIYVESVNSLPHFDHALFGNSLFMTAYDSKNGKDIFYTVALLNVPNMSKFEISMLTDSPNGPFQNSMIKNASVELGLGAWGIYVPEMTSRTTRRDLLPPTLTAKNHPRRQATDPWTNASLIAARATAQR